MKPSTERLFLLLAALHLLFLLQAWPLATAVSKALLMPTLLLFYVQRLQKPYSAFQKGIIVALVFSFLGDVLLIWGDETLFFIIGLSAFLLAQLTYMRTFLRNEAAQPNLVRKQPWLVLPVVGLGALIYWYLY